MTKKQQTCLWALQRPWVKLNRSFGRHISLSFCSSVPTEVCFTGWLQVGDLRRVSLVSLRSTLGNWIVQGRQHQGCIKCPSLLISPGQAGTILGLLLLVIDSSPRAPCSRFKTSVRIAPTPFTETSGLHQGHVPISKPITTVGKWSKDLIGHPFVKPLLRRWSIESPWLNAEETQEKMGSSLKENGAEPSYRGKMNGPGGQTRGPIQSDTVANTLNPSTQQNREFKVRLGYVGRLLPT